MFAKKLEPSRSVARNCWYRPLGKTFWQLLKKLTVELPRDQQFCGYVQTQEKGEETSTQDADTSVPGGSIPDSRKAAATHVSRQWVSGFTRRGLPIPRGLLGGEETGEPRESHAVGKKAVARVMCFMTVYRKCPE